jgi:hypothetical protein
MIGSSTGSPMKRTNRRIDPSHGNKLDSHIAIDQTFLIPLVKQLEDILSAYPVIDRWA